MRHVALEEGASAVLALRVIDPAAIKLLGEVVSGGLWTARRLGILRQLCRRFG
jgi:hypothetical protein